MAKTIKLTPATYGPNEEPDEYIVNVDNIVSADDQELGTVVYLTDGVGPDCLFVMETAAQIEALTLE